MIVVINEIRNHNLNILIYMRKDGQEMVVLNKNGLQCPIAVVMII